MKFHKIIVTLCAPYLIAQPLMAQPFAFVTNNNGGTGNTVTPIDIATSTAEAPITFVGTGPLGIAITPNGQFAYVADTTSNTVSVINTITDEIVATISSAPEVGPSYVAITPNGEFAYVTNSTSDTISVITVATNTVLTTIPLTTGTRPLGIAITPDGTAAYVATLDGVAVITTATNVQTDFISLAGATTEQIAITPNGEFAYVTISNNNTVVPITIATNTAGTPIPLGAGTAPTGIAITPNGTTAYITTNANGTVVPITIATNTAGAPIPLGALTFPQGIAITQDGTKAFVVQNFTNNVAIINVATNTLTGTLIGVGTGPVGIAITSVIPPSNFTGFIQQNKFLNVTECILTVQWTASPTTNVVSYEIFRNGTLFATIPATGSLLFTAGLGCNDTGAAFTIVAVDSNGVASIPVPLVLVPAPVLCR